MTTPPITYASTPRQVQVLFGEDGSGKTRAAATLAVAFPKSSVYVVSPQDGESWLRQQLGNPTNLISLPVESWADVRLWLEGTDSLTLQYDQRTVSHRQPDGKPIQWAGLRHLVKPGDFVVLDMVDEMATDMLRDYYCLRFHKKSYAEMVLAHGPATKRGALLSTFDEVDKEAWQRMKVLADSAFRWLFERRQVNVVMTCKANDVPVDGQGNPVYKTEPEYVRLGFKPRFPEVVQYGVNTVVFMSRKGSTSYQAQLVRKNRVNDGVVDTKPWEVGPVYWYSFCGKVGIDPKLTPGV